MKKTSLEYKARLKSCLSTQSVKGLTLVLKAQGFSWFFNEITRLKIVNWADPPACITDALSNYWSPARARHDFKELVEKHPHLVHLASCMPAPQNIYDISDSVFHKSAHSEAFFTAFGLRLSNLPAHSTFIRLDILQRFGDNEISEDNLFTLLSRWDKNHTLTPQDWWDYLTLSSHNHKKNRRAPVIATFNTRLPDLINFLAETLPMFETIKEWNISLELAKKKNITYVIEPAEKMIELFTLAQKQKNQLTGDKNKSSFGRKM